MGDKELCLFGFSVVLALKNRDKPAMLYIMREASNLFDPQVVAESLFKILKLIPDAFGLDDDDAEFYWKIAESFTSQTPPDDIGIVEKEMTEEQFEKACAKTVREFEEKGLILGVDYSFYNNEIIMSDKAYSLVHGDD